MFPDVCCLSICKSINSIHNFILSPSAFKAKNFCSHHALCFLVFRFAWSQRQETCKLANKFHSELTSFCLKDEREESGRWVWMKSNAVSSHQADVAQRPMEKLRISSEFSLLVKASKALTTAMDLLNDGNAPGNLLLAFECWIEAMGNNSQKEDERDERLETKRTLLCKDRQSFIQSSTFQFIIFNIIVRKYISADLHALLSSVTLSFKKSNFQRVFIKFSFVFVEGNKNIASNKRKRLFLLGQDCTVLNNGASLTTRHGYSRARAQLLESFPRIIKVRRRKRIPQTSRAENFKLHSHPQT